MTNWVDLGEACPGRLGVQPHAGRNRVLLLLAAMSGFSESEGDNADVIEQGDDVPGQNAVIEDRADSGDAATVQSTGKMDPQAPVWTKRLESEKHPPDRTPCLDRIDALEQTIRGYVDKLGGHVVEPAIGLTFDSLGEAYDFYNLYSWEHGFGIRYGKRRLNAEKTKCMHEVVCGCSGKPIRVNSRACKCECPAMIRLLCTHDNGWYITEHRVNHNHSFTTTCGDKGGVVVKCNILIERHASKIYTRAMFEQFGDLIYQAHAYRIEELEKNKMYKAVHT